MQNLPGEPTAEQILNGEYRFPPSPPVEVPEDAAGLARERLTAPPPPGVHPRVLLSPEDLPDLRRRVRETAAGQAMLQTLRLRTGSTIGCPGVWENDLYEKLAAGDAGGALELMNQQRPRSFPSGHYQPYILYALVMEAFDALLGDDSQQKRRVASAIATYAAMGEPLIERFLDQPLADDVWRVKISGPTTGDWGESQGLRDLVGMHLLGYAYDFAYNDMSDDQRAQVRRVIARVTAGRLWMGAQLPHHWRNWNWVVIGLSQPLLALAIEGEAGYDPRVYQLGVQIARDYLTYGVSPVGCATEAVGYTQFGLVWGVPFLVAAARRGDNLLTQGHHRAMIDWYLHSMEPFAPAWERKPGGDAEQQERNLPPVWTSHGDGGDEGPSLWTMAMWKYFFPNDPKIDFLWRVVVQGGRHEPFGGQYHIVEPLLWASDALTDDEGKLVNYADGAALGLPKTWVDPERGSLITRSDWSTDALTLQLECRPDTHTANHEHADRGNFTLSALGRSWARESFRSVETRHHNLVLIDGMGQGFFAGPGRWLGHTETDWGVLAACDSKQAYDWWWPKEILAEDPDTFARFGFSRWESFREEAARFRREYGDQAMERDDRLAVAAHFEGFTESDPRMWDEDSWPVRLRHNPVRRAFRTVACVTGGKPYALIVDDIQKDEQERLYEWLMMTGPDTDVAALTDSDIVLCDATVSRDRNGQPQPNVGDRLLLVRALNRNVPARRHDYQAHPSLRLETFEKRDTLAPEGRSFGPDKRLVIPSRSVAPDYKVLLFPHRAGEPLPVTVWNADKTLLTLAWREQIEEIGFTTEKDGRTRLHLRRAGRKELTIA